MKQSSKRLTSSILALLFLVGSFLVFFEFIQPTYATVLQAKGTRAASEALLAQEQTAVSQAKQLLSQYENDSTAESNLALAMPSGPDVSGALAQIYGIATNNSIVVTNLSISPPTVPPQAAVAASVGGVEGAASVVQPIGTISFQMNGTGSYENLKTFLSELETNIRIFDLTALSIQPFISSAVSGTKTAPASTDDFTYNITVVTYFQSS